jgi:hypothetical protein
MNDKPIKNINEIIRIIEKFNKLFTQKYEKMFDIIFKYGYSELICYMKSNSFEEFINTTIFCKNPDISTTPANIKYLLLVNIYNKIKIDEIANYPSFNHHTLTINDIIKFEEQFTLLEETIQNKLYAISYIYTYFNYYKRNINTSIIINTIIMKYEEWSKTHDNDEIMKTNNVSLPLNDDDSLPGVVHKLSEESYLPGNDEIMKINNDNDSLPLNDDNSDSEELTEPNIDKEYIRKANRNMIIKNRRFKNRSLFLTKEQISKINDDVLEILFKNNFVTVNEINYIKKECKDFVKFVFLNPQDNCSEKFDYVFKQIFEYLSDNYQINEIIIRLGQIYNYINDKTIRNYSKKEQEQLFNSIIRRTRANKSTNIYEIKKIINENVCIYGYK